MKTMKNTISLSTLNNVSQFKVNRLGARQSENAKVIKPVRHVVMLWEDENDDAGMAMATTETKEKWAKKLAKKAQFVDIEINRNIMLEDEFIRESGMIAMFN